MVDAQIGLTQADDGPGAVEPQVLARVDEGVFVVVERFDT
jgi:hypothetical protein